jgi:hypothetical protein
MSHLWRVLTEHRRILLGLQLYSYALYSLYCFSQVPADSPWRWCGNHRGLGQTVPIELGLLGILLICFHPTLPSVRSRIVHGLLWLVVLLAILATGGYGGEAIFILFFPLLVLHTVIHYEAIGGPRLDAF